MSLSTAQLTTLKADIDANSGPGGDFEGIPNTPDGNQAIAEAYNLQASPDYYVWQMLSSLAETGMALLLSDVSGLTTANSNRIQVSFQVRPNGFEPSLQSDRALFGDVFSVAGASGTRSKLLTAWQRLATRAEKVLKSAGTGTQATGLNSDGTVTGGDPATLGHEGPIDRFDVENARAL